METQTHPPDVGELVEALKRNLATGLPISPNYSDGRLLGLRGVHARSVDPDLATSRVKALSGLLSRLLVHYPDDVLGEPARILFGLAAGHRGTLLTQRRAAAASVAGYDPDHFRKHIEPKILQQVAWQLHQDSLNYVPRGRVEPPRLEPSGDTPVISLGDVASKEHSEHQELLSRLWAAVYNLRAEILRCERLKTWPYDPTEEHVSKQKLNEAFAARDAGVAATKQMIRKYIETYGSAIGQGEGEFSAEGLLRLAGWDE